MPPNRLMQMPQMSAYQPTLRDRMANKLLGWMGDGYGQQRFVENLIGSSGLGAVKPGVADFIPLLGQALQGDEAGRQMAQGQRAAGTANLLLAALPIPAVAKGANKLIRGAREAEAAAPIVAYHGSPHQFEQFDLGKIGTGEGAQAYGHGLYFAENEGVARGYRDALSLPSSAQNDVARHWLSEARGDKGHAIHLFADHAASVGLPAEEVRAISETIQGGGHLYQVGINAAPDHFLDWDAPLRDQPKAHAALAPHGATGMVANGNAGEAYRAIQDRLGPERAAQVLHEAGVPGIRYRDAGSRLSMVPLLEQKAADRERQARLQPWDKFIPEELAAARKELEQAKAAETRNYVVFNPKIIQIMKRYGVAAPIAAGMLAGGQYGTQSQEGATQ